MWQDIVLDYKKLEQWQKSGNKLKQNIPLLLKQMSKMQFQKQLTNWKLGLRNVEIMPFRQSLFSEGIKLL